MPKSFSMKLRGGNVAPPAAFMALLGPPLRRAAYVVQGGVMKASPVLTGTLRRSWTTSPSSVIGVRVVSRVGTSLVYARYQNTRTRNRGYVKRGIDVAKTRAKQVLQDGMREVVQGLWEK